MLDSDLARLYQCKNGTKSINLAVKRNINRFPNDFYFQLNKNEFQNLKFQFETSSLNNYGGIRKLPYAFTEEGVAMLATVIKTDVAEEISVNIMRAFTFMRKYISTNLIEQKYINDMVLTHDKDIKLLQESFNKFEEKKKVNEIYFKGQIYDAYSKILDIISEAQEELIIVDGYADKVVLDMVKDLKVNVILIVKKNQLLSNLDISKYIEYFQDSFLISKAERYDIKGKNYINSPYKYYFEDIGLHNARLNFRQTEENHIMENIIYNELKSRGYKVDIGVVENIEKNKKGNIIRKNYGVDFIATQGGNKYYIQSALNINTSEKEM